jgi:hypothetical protein
MRILDGKRKCITGDLDGFFALGHGPVALRNVALMSDTSRTT